MPQTNDRVWGADLGSVGEWGFGSNDGAKNDDEAGGVDGICGNVLTGSNPLFVFVSLSCSFSLFLSINFSGPKCLCFSSNISLDAIVI